ncbi:MAG: CaiB/BaiF CoA-transferase family protein, partial [Woeseiaceae bacterium]
VPLGDYISSLYGAIGVLMALRHREKTGRGQVIDVAIFESVFRTLDEIAGAYGLYGKIREREGSGSFVAVPHGHFRTRDDKWVAIACTTDRMFERLAVAMDRPELAAPDAYGAQAKRLAARDDVNALVTTWVESFDRTEIMRRCLDAEVPCGKVNSIADIFEDEHFRERGTLATVDVPGVGEVTVPNVLPRLSATPGRISGLGPALGDSTVAVLRELLGLSEKDIAQLEKRKVI